MLSSSVLTLAILTPCLIKPSLFNSTSSKRMHSMSLVECPSIRGLRLTSSKTYGSINVLFSGFFDCASEFSWDRWVVRLQNSPYFCVFKYSRAVKQKVSCATLYRFLYWFWGKNPTVLQSTELCLGHLLHLVLCIVHMKYCIIWVSKICVTWPFHFNVYVPPL